MKAQTRYFLLAPEAVFTSFRMRFVRFSLATLVLIPPLLAQSPTAARTQILPVTDVVAREAGENGQPAWASRGRFSTTTNVYVQDPFEAVVDLDYELSVPRHRKSAHLFTQELELGLPYRFQLAYENVVEVTERRGQVKTQNFELRWAPAPWGKIPLNPTIFAEYKIGIGKEKETEEKEKGPEVEGKTESDGEAAGKEEKESRGGVRRRDIPNAFEIRLLLAEQFGDRVQWAMNIFHEQEIGGDRETETGFSQAISYAVADEIFHVGLEMQFIRRTNRETRGDPTYEFDLGPSLTWKPTRRTTLDVAALFGTTEDSPALALLAVCSIELGRERRSVAPDSKCATQPMAIDQMREARGPTSTRNR